MHGVLSNAFRFAGPIELASGSYRASSVSLALTSYNATIRMALQKFFSGPKLETKLQRPLILKSPDSGAQSLLITARRETIPALKAYMRIGPKGSTVAPIALFVHPKIITASEMRGDPSPENPLIEHAPFHQPLGIELTLLENETYDLTLWVSRLENGKIITYVPMGGMFKLTRPDPQLHGTIRIGILFVGIGLKKQKWHEFRLTLEPWDSIGLVELQSGSSFLPNFFKSVRSRSASLMIWVRSKCRIRVRRTV